MAAGSPTSAEPETPTSPAWCSPEAGSLSLTLVREAWHAFAAAALVGLGASVTWPAQDALLATTVAPQQRSSALSVRHATFNGGLGAEALIAATVVDVSRPRSFVVLYLLDAASVGAFIPILLILPGRPAKAALADKAVPTASGGFRLVFRDPTLRRVWALAALVVAVSHSQYHSGFPAYAARPGPAPLWRPAVLEPTRQTVLFVGDPPARGGEVGGHAEAEPASVPRAGSRGGRLIGASRRADRLGFGAATL